MFLLIVVGAVVGTLAYLTDRDAKTNVFTIGDINIELLEYERTDVENKNEAATVKEFEDNKPLIPGVIQSDFDYTADGSAYVDWTAEGKADYQSPIWDPADINNELDKMVFIKNTGTNSAYVRMFLAFEAGAYTSFEQFSEKVHLNLNDKDWTWKWEPYIAKIGNEKYFIATATYNHVLEPGTLTEISLAQIALDPSATNLDVNAFGKTYNVPIIAQGIQTASFSDPVTALETGFGDDIPFEGITFDKGVSLKTALTYFEGNVAGTNIYKNVENIIFGTKDAYPEVKSSYSGTLTLNDQGAPTHTYYVPSKTTEGNYDLYVLADEGKIYTPENSDSLFSGMTSLVTVNTSNLDVGQTTSMRTMFSGCQSLETVDVSSWNVENVAFMNNMFQNCYKLSTLDVSDWDVSNVTKMGSMFKSCYELQNIDVSKWTVSKVTDMAAMFQDCKTFTALEVSGWNTAKVNYISSMFSGCVNLASIGVSNWTVDNVTEMHSMFKNCPKLASPMDLSGWNVGKVTSMMLMFEGCTSLTELNVSGWNVSNATSLRGIFKNCNLLTELEVAGWSVSEKNTSLLETFYGCSNLKQLDLSSWTVSGVTDMTRTFAACSSLTSLNVSTWKLNEVATITLSDMFSGCSSLASLNVSDWNVNKVTSMTSLFQNCSALTSLDVSGWSVGSVTAMNNMFLNCKKLTALDLNGWNTAEVKHARNMFRGCSELVTIYVGDGWEMSQIPEENVDKGTGEKSSALMFFECPKLVGEKGTTYNKNNVDKTYARIDGGTSAPGYLTYKEHTPTTP